MRSAGKGMMVMDLLAQRAQQMTIHKQRDGVEVDVTDDEAWK